MGKKQTQQELGLPLTIPHTVHVTAGCYSEVCTFEFAITDPVY